MERLLGLKWLLVFPISLVLSLSLTVSDWVSWCGWGKLDGPNKHDYCINSNIIEGQGHAKPKQVSFAAHSDLDRPQEKIRSKCDMSASGIFKVVLLRHGESQWNNDNKFCGWYDADLSDTGLAEAKSAGKVLSLLLLQAWQKKVERKPV